VKLAQIEAEIERLVERRHAIWCGAPSEPGEVARIAKALAVLYDDRRRAGAPDPATLRIRARVDAEIEQLVKLA
jgi:hypothetical protein